MVRGKLRKRRQLEDPDTQGDSKRTYVKLKPHLLKKAIAGTGGIMARIARNAGCVYNTALEAFKNSDKKWEECRLELEMEKQRIGDAAEHTMHYLVSQRIDFPTARKASEFILSRQYKERGFGDESTLRIKSDNPLIEIQQNNIDISKLDLPLPIKVLILEAIEKFQENTPKLIEG